HFLAQCRNIRGQGALVGILRDAGSAVDEGNGGRVGNAEFRLQPGLGLYQPGDQDGVRVHLELDRVDLARLDAGLLAGLDDGVDRRMQENAAGVWFVTVAVDLPARADALKDQIRRRGI